MNDTMYLKIFENLCLEEDSELSFCLIDKGYTTSIKVMHPLLVWLINTGDANKAKKSRLCITCWS